MDAKKLSGIIGQIQPGQLVTLTFEEREWSAVDKLVQFLNASLIVMPEPDVFLLRQAESNREWNNAHRQITVGGLEKLLQVSLTALADGIASATSVTHAAWTMLAGEKEGRAFVDSIITEDFDREVSNYEVRLCGGCNDDGTALFTLISTALGSEETIKSIVINGWTGQITVKSRGQEKILADLYTSTEDIHKIVREAIQVHMKLPVMT